MLVQRVDQQHGVRPLQFTARVSHDDGTSVLLNSLEDFEGYNEVRALRSVGLVFTWTFLLNFPGQPTPEKQEVEFSFGSKQRRVTGGDESFFVMTNGGTLSYRIKHTARTWGSDIEAMLTHYMDTLIQPQPAFHVALRKYSGWIGAAFGIALFAFLMGGFAYVNNRVLEEQSALLVPLLGEKASISSKLDGIVTFLSISRDSLRSVYSTFYVIVAVLGSVAAGAWVGTQAEASPPSGVLLTRRAEEQYAQSKKSYSESIWRFVFSIATAVMLGLAVNAVYDFAVKRVVEDLVERTNNGVESSRRPTR